MALNLITKASGIVTPSYDALVQSCSNPNGILYGCEVTQVDSAHIRLSTGYGIIGGRLFDVSLEESIVAIDYGTYYAGIKLTNTASSGASIEFATIYETDFSNYCANTTDKTIEGGISFLPLAIIKADGTSISSVTKYSRGYSPYLLWDSGMKTISFSTCASGVIPTIAKFDFLIPLSRGCTDAVDSVTFSGAMYIRQQNTSGAGYYVVNSTHVELVGTPVPSGLYFECKLSSSESGGKNEIVYTNTPIAWSPCSVNLTGKLVFGSTYTEDTAIEYDLV